MSTLQGLAAALTRTFDLDRPGTSREQSSYFGRCPASAHLLRRSVGTPARARSPAMLRAPDRSTDCAARRRQPRR